MTPATGDQAGYWKADQVSPDARSEPGLVVYRFSAPLYYANAEHFTEELLAFGTSQQPPEWLCVYAAAMPDIDMSGAEALKSIVANLAANGVTLTFAEVMPEVQEELDRYELTELIGPEHIFPTVGAAEAAFRARSNA
jgi:MFS superfamily sulfate permease-like transporter